MFSNILKLLGMSKLVAVIYSNGSQECERMSMLLKALDGEFHEYLLGVNFSDRQFRMEFGEEATYPQVSIGSKHIGNMKETLYYLQTNNFFTDGNDGKHFQIGDRGSKAVPFKKEGGCSTFKKESCDCNCGKS